MLTWIQNWLARHQHPASLVLHMIGIPLLALAAAVAAWHLTEGTWSLLWRPTVLMALSYLLQGVGHAIEGNDMGEVILIKKLMGRSYITISPKYRSSSDTDMNKALEQPLR